MNPVFATLAVITSYSIHYTKLYDFDSGRGCAAEQVIFHNNQRVIVSCFQRREHCIQRFPTDQCATYTVHLSGDQCERHIRMVSFQRGDDVITSYSIHYTKLYDTNAGADANENAMRMARLFTGRDKILSGYRSYHGNTGSAIVATGDFRRVPRNNFV